MGSALPRFTKYAALAFILVFLAGLGGAGILFPPRPVLAWLADLNPRVLFYVDTDQPAVALTIDDGPSPELTPRILDLLAKHEARATFFLIGDHIQGNETLLRRMSAEGHELANHLQSDEPSIGLSARDFERQLLHVDSLIAWAGDTKWFRPGSGLYDPRMLRQLEKHGYRCSLGSFYPLEPLVDSPGLFAEQVLSHIEAGAIIILHEGGRERASTLEVLERILPEIRARGFRVLTLSELVALEGAIL